jgi:hypothetical protein
VDSRQVERLNLVKNQLKRRDTQRTAFDVNILTFRGTYQFTRATFARAIIDYNTLSSRLRAQFLAGWTPSPGTSLYLGYNDDLNYLEAHPFTRQIVPGFRRNSRTVFIKTSYLFRKSLRRIAVQIWSALTCQRFGRSRPVATYGWLIAGQACGVRPPQTKALTGQRTPIWRESAASDLCTRYREIAAWVKIATRLNHAGNPHSSSERR